MRTRHILERGKRGQRRKRRTTKRTGEERILVVGRKLLKRPLDLGTFDLREARGMERKVPTEQRHIGRKAYNTFT